MESLGFVLMVLGGALVLSLASIGTYALSPVQRTRPGVVLIGLTFLAVFVSFVLVVVEATFFGVDPIVLAGVGVTWLLASPVLVRAWANI